MSCLDAVAVIHWKTRCTSVQYTELYPKIFMARGGSETYSNHRGILKVYTNKLYPFVHLLGPLR